MPNIPKDVIYSWAPDWLVSLALIIVAIVAALVAHALVQRVLQRLWVSHHPVIGPLIRRAQGLTRYGLILFALSITMPVLPLDIMAASLANKVFIAGLILLIGWVVLLAANLSADYYVGRFQVGAVDDLLARKAVTQVEVLKRIMDGLIITIAIGFALMTFDSVRQLGVSLFASAGVVGLIAGVALRSILANFFAGLQIALTQPIRLNDVVTVENELGHVEELTSSYVVLRLWDLRRLIVPLSYFMEKPFHNWTRTSAQTLGTVSILADYTVPVERLREKAQEIVEASPLWDKQVFRVDVTDMKETGNIETRVLVSAANSTRAWDLRCEIREKLIAFIRTEYKSPPPRVPAKALERENVHDGQEPVDVAQSGARSH